MKRVDLCSDYAKTGHQGVKILKNSFGVHKRVWVCFVDEGIEAKKISNLSLNWVLLCNADKMPPRGRTAAMLGLRHINWYMDVQAEGSVVYGKRSLR